MRQLEAEGYVYHPAPSGAFLSARVAPPAPGARRLRPRPAGRHPLWRLDLKSNRVDTARFPVATWARLTRQVLTRGRRRPAAAGAPPGPARPAAGHCRRPAGLQGHGRLSGADRGGRRGGIPVSAAGPAAGPRTPVLCRGGPGLSQDPPGLRQVRRRLPSRFRWTARGWTSAALAASGATAVHLSPSHHYPTGPGDPHRPAAGPAAVGGGHRTASSSRTTTTASSAFPAGPSPRCRASTPGAGDLHEHLLPDHLPLHAGGLHGAAARAAGALPPGAGLLRLHRPRPGAARPGPVPRRRPL